ncbi:MAG: deoxyhypusine synthase family protein, partial [Planctomycetota bacterium]
MTRANETAANPAPLGGLPDKASLLSDPIQHIDIKATDVRPLVDAMGKMAFSSRDLHRAATIYDHMLADTDCAVILCLAGSLVSAGLKHMIVDLIE